MDTKDQKRFGTLYKKHLRTLEAVRLQHQYHQCLLACSSGARTQTQQVTNWRMPLWPLWKKN